MAVAARGEVARGELVAAVLACSWRAEPPALRLTPAELNVATPLLLESGGAALAWRRVARAGDLNATQSTAELRQAYRLHTLQAAIHEHKIKEVFALLRAAGVEPLLVKGWAVARLYPEPGLRPYGDIDLCVRPADYAAARAALIEAGDKYPVDLHRGLRLLDRRGWDEVFARTRLVPLGDGAIRVLAAEDHLRILCFHLLRHGVERPVGLCDIAAAVETRAPEFDWSLCLGAERKQADWVACTVGLAGRLLGARIADTPVAQRAATLPRWLVAAVLRSWGRPFSQHFTQQDAIAFRLRHPRGLARALARRWPTPVLGTVGVGGSFNSLPRFPYQLGYLFRRSGLFLKGLVASSSTHSTK